MKKKSGGTPAYLDCSLSFEERAEDLVSRMTTEEKLSQMIHDAPAVPRLGIPAYNWWNEALHGVARSGIATVFPQAIALAATFSPGLIYDIACAISDEARAKHHEAVHQGDRGIYKGLTLWGPNINIFRDPRWGRGHETYGEDPYLTGKMGAAYVKGIQGDDPKYLKAVATPKHAFAHSGPEIERESFDAKVSKKDLRETYLPAFRECIDEAEAASVMTAYNSFNGNPCSASYEIMEIILRRELGFKGFIVSDCGAVCNIHKHHGATKDAMESAALAVNNGLDLNCGNGFYHLGAAVEKGLVSEKVIDTTVKRLFTARFKLGMFDPDENVSYAQIPYEINDCKAHRNLSLEAARRSIVLLKNKDGLLPLSKDIGTIAVIGPNADNREVLLASYHGWPSASSTILDGIRNNVQAGTKVYYTKGCTATGGCESIGESTDGFSEALAMAQRADAIVMCMGLNAQLEGEKGDAYNSDAGGDKRDLNLPEIQSKLLECIQKTGKPVILVIVSGSALAVNWADENIPSIIQAFYPGQEGGNAVADIIFGNYCPSGRLPVTFYKTVEELPSFDNYSMEGRTYRYMTGEPLYPFGYGLSYTKFIYSDISLEQEKISSGENIKCSVMVENAGIRPGYEIVQLYIQDEKASVRIPRWQLGGLRDVFLNPGEKKLIEFEISHSQMTVTDSEGTSAIEPGYFTVHIGGSQPDDRSVELLGKAPLKARFVVTK